MTLQSDHWDPLLEWARNTFSVEIHKFESILSNKQPEATKQRFIEELKTFTSWEMAGRYISILNGVGSHGKNSHGTSHVHNEIVLDCFGVG